MNVHPKISSFGAVIVLLIAISFPLRAADLPMVAGVEWQPFSAQVWRLIEAAESLGSPFGAADKTALQAALNSSGDADAIRRVQELLDAHCLLGVSINPEMRVKVSQGPAKPELMEQGWRQFLVKVLNESGTTAPLVAVSPNAISLFDSGAANTSSDRAFRKRGQTVSRKPADLWLDLQTFDKQPLRPTLSGLAVEYRIVQLYSRDTGRREAKISFNVGQGTQDIGYRNDVDI
ncbi:MAG: hypothetical protein H7X97_06795, partial [Opitutaceae bacterium]|nr:hypothetical protein [Verrucomicrobiales bacterium]